MDEIILFFGKRKKLYTHAKIGRRFKNNNKGE